MKPSEKYVIEWSNSQKRFHIQTVDQAVSANLESMREGSASDYIVVGIADTHKEACEKCDELMREAKGFTPIAFSV